MDMSGPQPELRILNDLGDLVVGEWKSGSRSTADAHLADLVRRIGKLRLGEQVFWRVVAECGFLNLSFDDRPVGVDGAAILSASWERVTLDKICEFRGESSVRTWLYRIGKNVARDLDRSERRHRDRATDRPVEFERPTGKMEGSSYLAFCLDLQAARAKLNDDEVELLDLWLELGDRSGAAISRRLGTGERTVRNQLDRLFVKLGIYLDDPKRNRNAGTG